MRRVVELPSVVLLLTRVVIPPILYSTTYHSYPFFRLLTLFPLTYSLHSLALFPLQTCSIKLPVMLLMPKAQVIGLTHFALCVPNLSTIAVSALRKSLPSIRRYNAIEEGMHQDLEQFREVLKCTTNIRRPLYRQNSMDFMQSAKLELRRTDAFSRYVISSSIYPFHSF